MTDSHRMTAGPFFVYTPMTSSLSLKQRQFIEREQAILAAAEALFVDDNWTQVTVEQIAQQAEVAKGTVYKHFASKEALYARISLNFHHQLLDSFRGIDLQAPVLGILRRMLATSFAAFLQRQNIAQVGYYCRRPEFIQRLTPELFAEFEQLDQAFFELLHQVIDRGIREGALPPRPLEDMIFGIQACFDGAIGMLWRKEHQLCPQHHVSDSAFIDNIIEFTLAGIAHLPAKPGSQPNCPPDLSSPPIASYNETKP